MPAVAERDSGIPAVTKGAVTSRPYVVSISKTALVVGQNVDLAGGNQDFSYLVIAPPEK